MCGIVGYGILCFNSGNSSVILKELPYPVQQDQSDSQSYKDMVHRFRCREIA